MADGEKLNRYLVFSTGRECDECGGEGYYEEASFESPHLISDWYLTQWHEPSELAILDLQERQWLTEDRVQSLCYSRFIIDDYVYVKSTREWPERKGWKYVLRKLEGNTAHIELPVQNVGDKVVVERWALCVLLPESAIINGEAS